MLFHCSLGSFPEHKRRLNTDEGSNSFTETEPQHSEDTSMWKVSTPLFGNRMYESRCNADTVSVDLLLIQHGWGRYGHTGKQTWRKSWTLISEDNFTPPKSTHTHSDTHTLSQPYSRKHTHSLADPSSPQQEGKWGWVTEVEWGGGCKSNAVRLSRGIKNWILLRSHSVGLCGIKTVQPLINMTLFGWFNVSYTGKTQKAWIDCWGGKKNLHESWEKYQRHSSGLRSINNTPKISLHTESYWANLFLILISNQVWNNSVALIWISSSA